MKVSGSLRPHSLHERVRLQVLNARGGNQDCRSYFLAWGLTAEPSRPSLESGTWMKLEGKLRLNEMCSQHDSDDWWLM